MNVFRILMAAAIAVMMTGCGDDSTSETTESSRTDGQEESAVSELVRGARDGFAESLPEFNPLLAHVDADTPYLFANVRRLPESVSDRMWEINELSTQQQASIFDSLADDEETPPAVAAVIKRITALSTKEGWRAAGLHPNPFLVVHGMDLMPAAQIELADEAAFAALIGEIEGELEEPLTRRDIDGREVIWIEIRPGFGLAASHHENTLSIALTPDDADRLARIAGHTAPAEPMGVNALQSFNEAQGFSENGSGFVELPRLVEQLLDPDSVVIELADEDERARFLGVIENPACVAEYTAIANSMPQTVFGYTRIDEKNLDMSVRQYLAPNLATALKPVAEAPVKVDRELSGLFNFGMAMDLIAAREFARGLVNGWVTNPPDCPSFSDIAKNAGDWQQALTQPIPPVVTNIHGLFLEAEDLSVNDQGMPTGGGTLALYMNQPQLLVGMAQMFLPAVASMDLQPGGDALPVPSDIAPQLAATDLELWMAMGESALGVAVGETHVPALKSSLQNTSGDSNLMAGRMNMALLPQIIGIAEGALADLDNADAQQGLEMQRAQYEAIAEIYDRASFQVKLTDRGIEMDSQTTLKD